MKLSGKYMSCGNTETAKIMKYVNTFANRKSLSEQEIKPWNYEFFYLVLIQFLAKQDENYILGCSNKMFNDFHSSIIIIWIVILWVSTLYIFLFPKPFLFNSRMDIQVDIFPQLFLSWHKKAMSRFNDHTLVWRVLCCAL